MRYHFLILAILLGYIYSCANESNNKERVVKAKGISNSIETLVKSDRVDTSPESNRVDTSVVSRSLLGSWVTSHDFGDSEKPEIQWGFQIDENGIWDSVHDSKFNRIGKKLILKNNFGDTDTLELRVRDGVVSAIIEHVKGSNTTIVYPRTPSIRKITYDKSCRCYLGKYGLDPLIQDKAILKINDTNRIVAGEFFWVPYHKDSRIGTIDGKISGDKLVAKFTFRQEGRLGVQPLIFLKKGDNFVSKEYESVLKRIDCKILDKLISKFN